MTGDDVDLRKYTRLTTVSGEGWSAHLVHTALQRWLMRSGDPVLLKDIGLGGAALFTRKRILPRDLVVLRLLDSAGKQIEIQARPVHSRRLTQADGDYEYLTGLAFTPGPISTDQTRAVENLLGLPPFSFSTATI